MQNSIHHLASKALPDEMQLANNSHQNWDETGVRLHYQLFYCTFKSENLGDFLKEHNEK